MSGTLVLAVWDQSNGEGRQSSTQAPFNAAPFYTTHNVGIRILGWDGFLTGSWTTPASDPYADPTNAVDGAEHSNRAIASPLSALGTCFALAMADQLKDLGETRNIIVVPNALASTSVLADWTDTGGFDTQPSYQTLLGCMKRRIAIAMRAPTARLLIAFAGGETEAADIDHPGSATTLAANLGTVQDDLNTFAGVGGPSGAFLFDKASAHFLLFQLSAGYAGAPLSWPATGTVRTAMTTVVGARTDTILANDGYNGLSIHLNNPQQVNRGQVGGTAFHAAP